MRETARLRNLNDKITHSNQNVDAAKLHVKENEALSEEKERFGHRKEHEEKAKKDVEDSEDAEPLRRDVWPVTELATSFIRMSAAIASFGVQQMSEMGRMFFGSSEDRTENRRENPATAL